MENNTPALPASAPQPPPAPEPDNPAWAFTQLAEKVALLEAAIAGLSAKREAMPDYSETLGEIAALLERIRKALGTLAHRPAMEITPDEMARQIAAAGKTARAADSAAMAQARDRMDKVAARLEYLEGTVVDARDQRRQRHKWGIGGVLAGMLLWSFLPGTIARALPDSWHLPERMAARTMDRDRWTAGERLLATSEPEHWRTVIFANAILQENREALGKCHDAAAKAKKPVRCAVEIGPGEIRPAD